MELRCQAPHPKFLGQRCEAPIGETPGPLVFLATVARWEEREDVEPDARVRDVRVCRRCGAYNVARVGIDRIAMMA